jgi:hypothetical protein
MRRLIALALTAALGTTAAAHAAGPAPTADVGAGLPDGVPPAALAAEPSLPAPAGWPFPEAFPRTSGTGRLAGGASYWTDFVLDDHGAQGLRAQRGLSLLAPTAGTFTYPAGPAEGNGADVFRAAVGVDESASWWRVDWRTLVDPAVPTAVWALDVDADATTGTDRWAGVPGLRSPGTDVALVVSAGRATLVDAASGQERDVTEGLSVDGEARSFVLRLPRAALALDGRSTVRLAAGLTGEPGRSLAAVPSSRGALPGQPPVFNLGFRSHEQEPTEGNDWRENAQAASLAAGDATPYALGVDWTELAGGRTTAEPQPTGASDRWYAASLVTGEGAGPPPKGDAIGPVYKGRIQPYSIYLPERADGPLRVTLLLHSTGSSHGQYRAGNPRLVDQLCEQRRSLCLTPLGYGPAGNYLLSAEVDLWRVWRAAADAFVLDADRSVVSGYSMGGYGAYRIGLTYPDLFGQVLVLAGQPDCGPRVVRELPGTPAGAGVCTTDGDTTALVPNARDLPFVIGQGALDQRIPVTNFLQHLSAFDRAHVEYAAEVRPAEDHLGYAVKDSFGSLLARLDERARVAAPGTVDYSFRPALQTPALGVGPDGAYWLSGVRARDAAPGTVTRVVAVTEARPESPLMTEAGRSADATSPPSPAVVLTRTRVDGTAPPRTPVLRMALKGVAEATVDAVGAGFEPREAITLAVTSDGPWTVTLEGLRPGTAVQVEGGGAARAGGDGRAVLTG